MQRGFPLALLRLANCPIDGRGLEAPGAPADFIVDGTVRCVACSAPYPVRDGVLSLVLPHGLHAESAFEMSARDQRNASMLDGSRPEWESAVADAIEVEPTIEALGSIDHLTICELGCGPGRYTVRLQARGATVMAVDLSRTALMVARAKLPESAQVALVQADVTTAFAAARAFDRVLATLHSNLPTADLRLACLAQVGRMLASGGRAVISMHHVGWRERLTRVPVKGRYPENGIYREFMTEATSRAEAGQVFDTVQHRYVNIGLPGVRSVRVSRWLASVPAFGRAWGSLMLAIVERPRALEPGTLQ